MHIKLGEDIKSSEITDEKVYLNRRTFLRAATLAGTVGASGLLYRRLNPVSQKAATPLTANAPATATTGYRTPTGEAANSFEDIASYNNFYEFDTSKSGVASAAAGFITRPWTVEVGGLAHRPRTFDLDDLLKLAPLEDRVYRFRCVEAWSMVIPWLGLPLAKVLAAVEPMGDAKYVKFVTLLDKQQMPNQRTDILDWPYQEGLRLDEALHPLTLLASGLYGKSLPPQNGAPLRLVVPWKYGFKSIKSIVKIELTDTQPATAWNLASEEEYGFYSNVNPNVDHPRWSQASERRIGQWGRIDTVMFNGYADQVASMYAGMDLKKEF